MTALATACRAMTRAYTLADDARIVNGAFKYRRNRDLGVAIGHLIPAPYGNDPELTRRIIAALQTAMENQHPYARLRRKMIEVALAGERLILARQETERQAAEWL